MIYYLSLIQHLKCPMHYIGHRYARHFLAIYCVIKITYSYDVTLLKR